MKNSFYKKLEDFYLQAPLNQFIYHGTTIKVTQKRAEISVPIESKYFHGFHAMHGSVYFKMLDDSAFFAAQSMVKDVFLLTAHFEITFTKPVTSGIITATGTLISFHEREYKAESKLHDSNNNLIGYGHGIFKKSRLKFSESLEFK